MSGELKHVSVSSSLTQAEWEDANTHYVDSSAQGDLLRLTSSGGIQRLAPGSDGAILVSGGTSGADPSWLTPGSDGAILVSGSADPSWLTPGSEGAILVSGGTSGADPSWLSPGSTNQLLQTTSSGGKPAWSNSVNLTQWTTWTPTVTQSSAITVSVTLASYMLAGKLAMVQARIDLESAGVGSTNIVVGGFPSAIAPRYNGINAVAGIGYYISAGTRYVLAVVATSSSKMQAYSNAGTAYFGVNPAVTVSTSDYIHLNLSYEVA